MKLYLLNALIIPYESKGEPFAAFMSKTLSREEYLEILNQALQDGLEVTSALGHQSTVDFLKSILPENVHQHFVFNREPIHFEEGEMGLVFRLTTRCEQMMELSLEELQERYKNGDVEFLLVSRVHSPDLILNPSNYFKKEENHV